MTVDHRERAFEAAIENTLLTSGGYVKTDAVAFDREQAIDPAVFIAFVKEAQPDTWKALEKLHGTSTESALVDDLVKALDGASTVLGVLWHGFKCFGMGTAFKTADELLFNQIREEAVADETLRRAANANTIENFRFVFTKALEGLFIDRLEQNEELFARYMNDAEFQKLVGGHLLRKVYGQIQNEPA